MRCQTVARREAAQTPPVPVADNHLIEQLPLRDKARLLKLCERVPLTLEEVLCEPGAPTTHVYFPTEGFISLVSLVEGSTGVEVGMVGREGMLGAQLTLGVATAPLRALVQGEGTSWRMSAAIFRAELERSEPLRRELSRYVYVLMVQLATSAACVRFHQISPRLARWLLMSQDRAGCEKFRVTQEFLAYMLGVRRVGISVAASALQRAGLIEYHRGDVTVLDRAGLEAAACTCYASDGRTYAEVIH